MSQIISDILITPRERQVIQLLSEGLTTKEISADLHISGHTVEAHKRNLITKLDARNTIHMICLVLQLGLLRSNEYKN